MEIELGCLIPDSTGVIRLPKGVKLYCPECGEDCDGGHCRVSFCVAPESGLKPQVRLQVNCRLCGCFGDSPSLESNTYGIMNILNIDDDLYGLGG